jgi:hypothetical protein
MSFQSLAALQARRDRWRVAFDRSGQIAAIMERSWQERSIPDQQAVYLKGLDIWFYIVHAETALQRGQIWRALYELETIRHEAVKLAGLVYNLETEFYYHADQLPPDFLESLKSTLAVTTDPAEIRRAVRAAVGCFFDQARALDVRFGRTAGQELEKLMIDYLKLWEV